MAKITRSVLSNLMSRKHVILIAIGAAIGLFFLFQQQLYDFFISPDGLSLAKSELCLDNQTNSELVALIDVDGGAKTTSLIFPQEKLCSPSPNSQTSGVVRVSVEDGVLPFCEMHMDAAGTLILKSFSVDGLCVWGE